MEARTFWEYGCELPCAFAWAEQWLPCHVVRGRRCACLYPRFEHVCIPGLRIFHAQVLDSCGRTWMSMYTWTVYEGLGGVCVCDRNLVTA